MIQIAPTLFGIKPAELICIDSAAIHFIWGDFLQELHKWPQLDLRKVRNIKAREQFFIFHHTALDMVLRDPNTADFLKKQGYPPDYNLAEYIRILINRINVWPVFPHEAGVFVGYPLKDVLGFMGLSSLPYVGHKGWYYFGQYEDSEQVFSRYEQARNCYKLSVPERDFSC